MNDTQYTKSEIEERKILSKLLVDKPFLTDKMCQRSKCDLCYKLTELADLIIKRHEFTNHMEKIFGELFNH